MAAKKGDGLLLVYSDVAPENDEEYNRWYNDEHIPERLSIPGVLNAARYEAVQGGPKYLAVYELSSHEAWNSDGWQKWLREPTEWSRRMSPSVIGTEYIRNLYRRVHPADVPTETAEAGMSPVLLVGRMSVPGRAGRQVQRSLQQRAAAPVPEAFRDTSGRGDGRQSWGRQNTSPFMRWNRWKCPRARAGTTGAPRLPQSGAMKSGRTWSTRPAHRAYTAAYFLNNR